MLRRFVSPLAHSVDTFAACRRGVIAIKFAILTPLLLAAIASGLDITFAYSRQSQLQAAVDAAVLAGAKELSLADTKRENVPEIVKAVVESYVNANNSELSSGSSSGSGSGTKSGGAELDGAMMMATEPDSDGSGSGGSGGSGGGGLVIETEVFGDPLQVRTIVKELYSPFLLSLFGFDNLAVSVKSTARVAGQPNICVLALDPSAESAIALRNSSRATGQNCAVFSNSTHSAGLAAHDSARLDAGFICSAGGAVGGTSSFSPMAITDCPTFDDPLADRPAPTFAGCDETDLVIEGGAATLWPGVYCGGLSISGSAKVDLKPGIYVIKDGPLEVQSAELGGTSVGFYLTGADANINFGLKSIISLEAPTSGEMAGLLFFEDRSRSLGNQHAIRSNDARVLLGTIYLSRSALVVDANSPIADQSAYTAIVARTLRLMAGPHLVLRTDYDQTDVPVPKGIRGAGQPVRLVE